MSKNPEGSNRGVKDAISPAAHRSTTSSDESKESNNTAGSRASRWSLKRRSTESVRSFPLPLPDIESCIVYRPRKGELGLQKRVDIDGSLRFTPVKIPKVRSRFAVTLVDSSGCVTMVAKLDSLPKKVQLKRHFGLCNQIYVEGTVLVPADSKYAITTEALNATKS